LQLQWIVGPPANQKSGRFTVSSPVDELAVRFLSKAEILGARDAVLGVTFFNMNVATAAMPVTAPSYSLNL
jgi:hypothetical protein